MQAIALLTSNKKGLGFQNLFGNGEMHTEHLTGKNSKVLITSS